MSKVRNFSLSHYLRYFLALTVAPLHAIGMSLVANTASHPLDIRKRAIRQNAALTKRTGASRSRRSAFGATFPTSSNYLCYFLISWKFSENPKFGSVHLSETRFFHEFRVATSQALTRPR